MAMLLVMFAVAIAAILALSFLRSQGPTMVVASNIDRHVQARAIAEDGLQLAISYIRNNDWRSEKTSGIWLSDQALSGGTFTVYGTDEDGNLADDTSEDLLLEVVGVFEGATHRVSARIQTGPPPIKLNVMFIVQYDFSLSSEETAKKQLFEDWGYTVTLLDDDATQAEFDSAALLSEVAFISSDASDYAVASKLLIAPIGVVYERSVMSYYFDIATNGSYASGSTIKITDNTHYVTASFPLGNLVVGDDTVTLHRNLNGYVASGARRLAVPDWGGSDYAILTVDTGDILLYGGTTPARRVKLPWTFDTTGLNANGRLLTRRALEWASGNEGGGEGLADFSDFSSVDLGSFWPLGSTNTSGNSVTLNSSGIGVQGNSDEARFLYQQLSGDQTLTTRVISPPTVTASSQAGVMVRQDTNPSAPCVGIFVTRDSGIEVRRRSSAGGTASVAAWVPGVSAPVYLRLTTVGNTITAYYSADGEGWIQAGTSMSLTSPSHYGIAAGIRQYSTSGSAQFDSIYIGDPPSSSEATAITVQWIEPE